jgi:hypothetical protein
MQDILGHADVEMTLQIYTDATKDLKKSEMINFWGLFQSTEKDATNKYRLIFTTNLRQSYDHL